MGLLDLVLPQRCAVCAHAGTPLCTACRADLQRLTGPRCRRCGAPTAWPVERCRECSGRRLAFASACAAVGYVGGAVALVDAWKERGIRKLASTAADLVVEALPPPQVHALVFVPPDGDRGLERGHHPPRRLARELGLRWQLPVADALVRTRGGPRQRALSRAERRQNVAGAFRVRRARVPPRLALIDDVYTTGATASAAASALRTAGARDVHVVTFARAVRSAS